MERGKERADLRIGPLRQMLFELEIKRDKLMDEVSHKQGEIVTTEIVIKRIYEMILDINKEEKEALSEKEGLPDDIKEVQEPENNSQKTKIDKVLNGKKNSKTIQNSEIIKRIRQTRRKNKIK